MMEIQMMKMGVIKTASKKNVGIISYSLGSNVMMETLILGTNVMKIVRLWNVVMGYCNIMKIVMIIIQRVRIVVLLTVCLYVEMGKLREHNNVRMEIQMTMIIVLIGVEGLSVKMVLCGISKMGNKNVMMEMWMIQMIVPMSARMRHVEMGLFIKMTNNVMMGT